MATILTTQPDDYIRLRAIDLLRANPGSTPESLALQLNQPIAYCAALLDEYQDALRQALLEEEYDQIEDLD